MLLARITFALILVFYLMLWTPLAIVMLFVWELPGNWIGWSVLMGNPIFLAALAGLFMRSRQRTSNYG